jgi:AAA family ATP:ADP antiporter
MASHAVPLDRRTWLDRLLSLATEVRAGEGLGAILLLANVFLLLGSYYLLKTVREALILSESGAEVKSYAAAGQALLLLFVIPAYGALATKLNRKKLIAGTSIFFALNLVLFSIVGSSGVREGIVFYLWLGIYNNFIVAQFWSFANDIYSEEQGKRLFPVIGIGSSLGAWIGAESARKLVAPIGPYKMMLVVAGVLLICLLLNRLSDRLATQGSSAQQRKAAKPLSAEGGFELIFHDRYLLLIAAMILLLNVVNSSGEFMFGKLVTAQAVQTIGAGDAFQAARGKFIGQTYGQFYGTVNLLGFLMQAFLASRVLKYMGVRGALFILPVISFGAYGMLLLYPVLGAVRVAKILENSTDYSIQSTTNQALYLMTSREAKYKAKAAIDTFVVRMGDMMQALLVFIGVKMAFTIQHFATITVLMSIAWMCVAGLIYREHKRLEERERRLRGPALAA